ncbi:HlyD family efflux transporter periplasmic adaptor subunit [Isosphaeraceae bacterium EP7]
MARLEPETGLILVGSRPGQRVLAILVKQGERVEAGAPLAHLEGFDAATAQLALAETQQRQAIDALNLKRESLKLEREAFDKTKQAKVDGLKQLAEGQNLLLNNLRKARVGAEVATKPAEGEPVPNKSQLDADLSKVAAEVYRAQSEKGAFDSELEFLDRKRALEDRALAEDSPANQAIKAQVDLARANLEQCIVKAPGAGRVLDLLVHAGEVGSGPLLLFGDTTAMVASAEVDQADLPSIRVGDAATVNVLGKVLPGKVSQVGLVVGRNRLVSVDPRAQQDLRIVPVVIKLDDAKAAADLVGMQVETIINPRPARSH